MKLRVATCVDLPEVDVDAAPLADALAAAGFDVQVLAWDDPGAAWDASVPTIIRSTWNYALDVAAYLAWIDRVAASGPLWNPPDLVRGNVHKRYLLDLAARGVPVIPTVLVERGGTTDVGVVGTKIVIKPEVGAGSVGARTFELPRDHAAALAHLSALTQAGAALVQGYVASVDTYGERSLVWIDGELSHAVRKSPRFAGDSERIDGPFPIRNDERAVADAALASIADRVLYARVDLARDAADRPMLMELELVEPSLYFLHQPGSAARYVAGLVRRLG